MSIFRLFRVGRSFFAVNRRSSAAAFGAFRYAQSRAEGYFNQEWWETLFPEILQEQIGKAGNPGQEVILEEYFLPAATEYCEAKGETWDPDEFVSYVANAIGDEKYNAINIIIDECTQELIPAWDDSYGGEGQGEKMYMSMAWNRGRTFTNMDSAFSSYKAAASARGIKLGKNPFGY